MTHEYDDIISLPHPSSRNHPRMSMYQRAAQFAPFAALTGHNAAINETARLTDSQLELSEHERQLLDSKLTRLLSHLHEHPTITVTYFIPDPHKQGGSYTTFTGILHKWDEYKRELLFTDGTSILTSYIIQVSFCDSAMR